MILQEAIEELTSLHQRCTQTYVSHYRIEQQLNAFLASDSFSSNSSIEDAELFNKFQTLKTELEAKLKRLKLSNKKLIGELDFDRTCKELINSNDIENFKGLINIGEYFGTGPTNKDVCSALDS
ncbi:MAG: hypothetical protein K2X39_00855, partial [Silvanigrellaceae bacterium]|nr:hypothetical protein [Silvanigrellaceae bacterium]